MSQLFSQVHLSWLALYREKVENPTNIGVKKRFVCSCEYMCLSFCTGQKKMSNHLELQELPDVGARSQTQVLARAGCLLNSWALSLAPKMTLMTASVCDLLNRWLESGCCPHLESRASVVGFSFLVVLVKTRAFAVDAAACSLQCHWKKCVWNVWIYDFCVFVVQSQLGWLETAGIVFLLNFFKELFY